MIAGLFQLRLACGWSRGATASTWQIDLGVEGLKTRPQLDSQPKPKHVTL